MSLCADPHYDIENHTENFLHTEKTKSHWKQIYKGNHIDNHTEIFSFIV